ncbi:MAG: hypothetical protein K8R85_12030 [Bacteroidetes bacterium]|nr:hypothetical protein [Bacteroidota bacterium]
MVKKDDRLALERYLDKISQIQRYSQVNLNESDNNKKLRIQRLKKDYRAAVKYYFPHYASSECADFQIEAANYIKKNKVCIDAEVWARGHAKSTHMDIMIPFWLWMDDQIDVMLLVGKSADDAKILLSDLQAEFEANPQILADFGEQKKLGSWEDGNFVTKNGSAFFSLGRGQSPRGIRYKNKRPNIVVIDDIDDDEIVENERRVLKVVKWIFGALYGAMDNKGARLLFANNLISRQGIIAKVIDKIKALSKGKNNARVNIVNALDKNGNPSWYQKYTKKYFDDLKEVVGDYAFQTEQMNNPQIEGKIFKDGEIQWAQLPRLDHFECIVAHWDVAYAGTTSADYNAIKIWGLKEKKFYCIKAFVRQCKMAEAIKFMIDFDRKLPENVNVLWMYESQFWNDALKMTRDQVFEETKYEIRLIQCERPAQNKFVRIVGMQPYYQNGRVYYNKKEEYNIDMQTGINQLKSIEPGYNSHDDSPDADEAAISYLNKFIPTNNPLPVLGERSNSKGAW